MQKISYVNQRYVPHRYGMVSIDDRSVLFGDSVYEVITILHGKPVDMESHVLRLEKSLKALDVPMPMSKRSLELICRRLVRLNRLRNGLVYIQISRGTAPRNHIHPTTPLVPSVVITTKSVVLKESSDDLTLIKVKSVPDNRWADVHIKTTMLLPNCLAKTEALRYGYSEILFVKDDVITECASANFFYLDGDGVLHTAPEGDILMGCTRAGLIACAKELQIPVVERKFSLGDAKRAKMAFLSSASQFLTPISHIDDTVLCDGVHPICIQLFDTYMKRYAHGD